LQTGGGKKGSGVADATESGDDLSTTTMDGIGVELKACISAG